ncbi:hypothetical protein [Archangium sp.]|uniref:hypothetical protein n=1 Tax=Archangium sp. TaxID=1872627 RepID=UPI002D2333E2|nr:hypothetical protein [Archangium sp.]HYO57278.1 hypothetical protein [Archangium sp.]
MKRFCTSVLTLSLVAAMTLVGSAHAKQAGAVIIRNESNFYGFIQPELNAMRADVVKFHLSYDGDWGWPAHFVIPAAHLNSAVNNGARDIIVRTAETRINKDQINHFIQGMRFWDTGERLVDWIYNNRNRVHVWIEVGNEPDLAGADPWVHRWHLLDVANNIIPQWTWLWTMHWIASAPARADGYADVFYHANHEGSVQSKYESIGTHEYGDYDFNMAVTNKALGVLPAGKVIWITEAGINHNYDWGHKCRLYRSAIWNNPDSRIRGWTFFLLAQDPYWNTCPNGDGSCLRYGIDTYYNSANPIPGRPCATELYYR